jgi:DNA-binding transcriptional LysR family regulator
MELRDIEYFAVIAEHGNLGRAAEALGLSTPALSKSLRRLERGVKAKLVRRTPQGIELSAAGAALLSHARRLRIALDDVSKEVANIAEGRLGLLRVGANQFSIEFLLPSVCEALLMKAPKLAIKIIAGGNDVHVPAIQAGRLDLLIGFIPSAPDGLYEEHLMTDHFVVYASARHRLARNRRLTVQDIACERWALGPATVPDWQWLHRIFEEHALPPPEVIMETSATPLRLHAVASSGVLGFAPRRFVMQAASRLKLVELPVKELRWPCRLAVRYRKDAYLSAAALRFIDILKLAATAAITADRT